MWAHSVNVCGRRHRLSAHSRATADLARAFAAPFGAGGLAAALGLLHDAGKASTAWQRRLLMVEAAPGKGGCAAQGTRRAIGLVDGRSGRDGDPGSSRHLLTRRLNEDLITGMWDDLLRVAASVKGGHASAALVVGKLCSSKRQQNALASAIKEYGALRRTVYAARYLADETYRRRIGRQLTKQGREHARPQTVARLRERGRAPAAAPRASRQSRCGASPSPRTPS